MAKNQKPARTSALLVRLSALERSTLDVAAAIEDMRPGVLMRRAALRYARAVIKRTQERTPTGVHE